MEPFTTLTSIGIPLPWPDVNTDDIFPAAGKFSEKMLTDQEFMGKNAFALHRNRADGTPNPDFVLNQTPYDRGQILIAGRNFGCGSSREMAVWALVAIGIRCIIAPSFADIFQANCMRNGLLPVTLGDDSVAALAAASTRNPTECVTVDLVAQTVRRGRESWSFEIGGYQRHMLLNGLDEIGATLERLDRIEAHEASYQERFPWLATTRPET